MTTDLPFINQGLAVYLYEPFSYRWTTPISGTTVAYSASSAVLFSVTKTASNVVFANTTGLKTTSSNESIVITANDASGNVLATSSNTVVIGHGRFVTDVSSALEGQRFVFYKNEPITPIVFSAPFTLASTPVATPTLPFGLSLVSNTPSQYKLSGTPIVQLPNSNYRIIGSNGPNYIYSDVNIAIGAERLVLDLSGTGIASLMQVGVPIQEQVLTARYPPYPWVTSNLRYTWTPLPLGLEFADSNGIPVTSPFSPTDASSTLILRGTPSLAGAKQFASLGITSATTSVSALRINPSPNISNAQSFDFSFAETVLFDDVSLPLFYTGVTLDPSANFFRAQTYFGTGAAITTIFSPDLRSDLSLNFVPSQGRAYLTGTPLSAGANSYTIRASNANGRTQDIASTVQVVTDSVAITGPLDVCYSFILSRPVSLPNPAYYPTPIAWTATAASGLPVGFSAPALSGTGLSLSVSGNVATLSGLPDTLTSLRTLRVTASAIGSPATASRDVSFAIVNDVFTFADISASSLSFIQNKSIAPFQVSATTLSERSVISYTSSNLPTGLGISTAGIVSGTPTTSTSGSFTVVGSTGYALGSRSYSYTIIPDTVLFQVDPTVYAYSPGAAVSIDLNAVTYSGTSVSNYTFSNFTQSYGLSINSTTGVISGNLIDGIPPGTLLPVSCNFYIDASAGSLDASLSATMVTTNPVVHRNFLLVHSNSDLGPAGVEPAVWFTDVDTLSNWQLGLPGEFTDFRKKNDTVDFNTYIVCGGQSVYRSTTGASFSSNTFGDTFNYNKGYTAWNVSNSSNWFIAGTGYDSNNDVYRIFYWTSSDDGQTWTRKDGTNLRMASRQSSYFQNYYSTNGVAFASNSGVLLMGGGINAVDEYFLSSKTVLRSLDEGSNWSDVAKPFEVEVATFNPEGSVWVMAGSSEYSLGENTGGGYFVTTADTLRWSDDQGDTWNPATGVTPDVGAYTVAYASNTWLASGTGIDSINAISTRFVCSYDGKAWSNVTLPDTFTQFGSLHLPEVGPLWTDGSNWNAMVKLNTGGSSPNYDCKIYTHSLTGDLTTGWSLTVSSASPLGNGVNFVSSFAENFVRLGTPTTVTFTFNSLPAGGPTITHPTQRFLTFYQYVRISPIQFTATGTGTIYYFVDAAELPVGLTFDPLTATLSGKSVVLGTKSFSVYAKDNVGVTRIVIRATTILPQVVRDPTTASAYTSLLRQYTVVNAAQNAENNVVYPSEARSLGEFTSPYPPDEITQRVDPKCYSTSNCP